MDIKIMSVIYSPFNEETFSNIVSIENTLNLNRTFEELISERGDLQVHYSEEIGTVDYNVLFEKIKSKLYKINTLPEIDISEYSDVKQFKENFLEIKKNACTIYIKFMKAESELTKAKEKYNTFCENLKKCINSIEICEVTQSSDEILKSLLESKIDEYYTNLKIEELQEKFTHCYTDFEKTKYKINTLTGSIIPSTTCQICLEHQVDYFIDPCGHTICKHCKLQCENNDKCHYCRSVKYGYKRLYL